MNLSSLLLVAFSAYTHIVRHRTFGATRMLDLLRKLHSVTMRTNTTDLNHAMSSTSARNTQQESHDQPKLLSHQAQHSEREVDGAKQTFQQGVMAQQQPEDGDLDTQPLMSSATGFNAQASLIRSQLEQRYNEALERKKREWGMLTLGWNKSLQ